MSVGHWTLVSVTCFLFLPAAQAESAKMPDPLFRNNEALEVRIIGPLSTLTRERPLEEELPAKIQYTDANGAAIELDIQIRARGRYRHRADICQFPPARLNFKKSSVVNTLFENQDKLKLVSHCRPSGRYTEAVLREFLTYRLLNALSDASYKARLLRITYVDTENKSKEDIRYGFVIEHRDRLAARLQMRPLEISNTTIGSLQADHSNLISLFHYMIGNTDFSQIRGAAGEPCCHNHVLFQAGVNPIYSIPYDFDQSGVVGAPHASPNPRFGLRSAKQRLYRGRCVNNELLSKTIDHFDARQEAVMALVAENPDISNSTRRTMTSYLQGFYKTIGSEKRIARALIKRCI